MKYTVEFLLVNQENMITKGWLNSFDYLDSCQEWLEGMDFARYLHWIWMWAQTHGNHIASYSCILMPNA